MENATPPLPRRRISFWARTFTFSVLTPAPLYLPRYATQVEHGAEPPSAACTVFDAHKSIDFEHIRARKSLR